MSLVGLSDREGFVPKAATGAIGPGSYDYKLAKDIVTTKRRSRSDRPFAFGSGAVKNLNNVSGTNVYSPAPGYYQVKNKASFTKEYMKCYEDQDSYYMIQNGTLLRKLQQFSANSHLEQRPDITGLSQNTPGPGQYSPRQH